MTDFRRSFGNANSPLPLSYLDDNFGQLENTSTSTVTLAGAGLVGFIADGAGAGARPLQGKVREIVSITDFKNDDGTQVLGDGSRQNRTGINKALAAAQAVYIPAPSSKYIVEGGVSATVARRIYGDGRNISIIECSDNTADILTFPDNNDYISLTDFKVQFATKNTGDGIVFTNQNNNVVVERVAATNCDIGFNGKNLSFLQLYIGCDAHDCNTGFAVEGRNSGGGGGGTTIFYQHCYANRCNTGFSCTAIKEVFFLQPIVEFAGAETSPKGIYTNLCTQISVKGLVLEGTVGADGYGLRCEGSALDSISLDAASPQVVATGFNFYLYSVSSDTGSTKIEVRNVSGRLCTAVKEYLMKNESGGTLVLNKCNNDFGTISGTNVAEVAGTFTERNWDTSSPVAAKGTTSVADGGNLDTGVGSTVAQVLALVKPGSDAVPTVMVQVTDFFSNGLVKIRYTKLSDGTEDFGTYTINWIAFK